MGGNAAWWKALRGQSPCQELQEAEPEEQVPALGKLGGAGAPEPVGDKEVHQEAGHSIVVAPSARTLRGIPPTQQEVGTR